MGVKNGLKDNTICWDCAKACNSGCSWSDGSYTPVEGWEARPDVNSNGIESFLVVSCPEFVRETPGDRDWRDLDSDGCVALVERLMEITADDYEKCRTEELIRIEKFIRGKGASRLHMINNPEQVIKALREKRKAYQQRRLSMMKG